MASSWASVARRRENRAPGKLCPEEAADRHWLMPIMAAGEADIDAAGTPRGDAGRTAVATSPPCPLPKAFHGPSTLRHVDAFARLQRNSPRAKTCLPPCFDDPRGGALGQAAMRCGGLHRPRRTPGQLPEEGSGHIRNGRCTIAVAPPRNAGGRCGPQMGPQEKSRLPCGSRLSPASRFEAGLHPRQIRTCDGHQPRHRIGCRRR